jgi:hypothetical protein
MLAAGPCSWRIGWRVCHRMASARNVELVKGLGADEATDYRTKDLTMLHYIDRVLDTVGGPTLESSWSVPGKGGRIATLLEFDIEARKAPAGKVVFIAAPCHIARKPSGSSVRGSSKCDWLELRFGRAQATLESRHGTRLPEGPFPNRPLIHEPQDRPLTTDCSDNRCRLAWQTFATSSVRF